MYKKILLLIISFGCLANVFADTSNNNAGDDFAKNDNIPGFNQNNNSDFIPQDESIISDYNPGIYLGGQLGMSNMYYGPQYMVSGNKVDNRKFAGRACIGYSFSQFIAAEIGYDYYGYPKFIAADGNTQNILQYGIDLSAKASLPLDYGFGLYIKGGADWIHRGALHSNQGDFAEKSANGKVTPVVALGINYWFAPNIAFDLSWTKTMTIGDLPTTDFFGLGITYKINI